MCYRSGLGVMCYSGLCSNLRIHSRSTPPSPFPRRLAASTVAVGCKNIWNGGGEAAQIHQHFFPGGCGTELRRSWLLACAAPCLTEDTAIVEGSLLSTSHSAPSREMRISVYWACDELVIEWEIS